MELIYSMRRAPLAIDAPYLDSIGAPCAVSCGNVVAFTALTALENERCGGATSGCGSRVYVCDLNTPWNICLVVEHVYQVTALEWDMEGKLLLVGTSAGEVQVFGSREHLLNDWLCLYTASLPGEHIVKAAFFHTGRRLVMHCDKPEAPCTERVQYARTAPTLRAFGQRACAGLAVVTATALVAAGALPAETASGSPQQLALATESLLTSRTHIAAADICYGNDGKLLIAVCNAARGASVRCCRVAIHRADSGAAGGLALQLTVHPLPGSRRVPDSTVRHLRWWVREDTDTLLVAADCGVGSVVSAWRLADRALPVHPAILKQAATAAPNKQPVECFNTVEWTHAHRYRVSDARVTSLACSWAQLSAGAGAAPSLPYVLVSCSDGTLRLLLPHLTPVCMVTLRAGGGDVDDEAGASGAAGPKPPKIPKHGSTQSSTESVSVCGMSVTRLGCVCVCVDSLSQLHVYKLPQPATDTPTPLSIQHAASLLEYAMVSGYDALDVLLTLEPAALEAVYERFTEVFGRQPAAFQQYYYVSWLCVRAALSRLTADGQHRASELTCLLLLHATSNAFKSLLRPTELAHDKGPAETLTALVQEDSTAATDIHKVMMVLEAKDFTAEPLALQSLRRLIQRVADIALATLAALRPRLKPPHVPHRYELSGEPAALQLMRELLVLSRVWGLLRAQALPTFARAPDGADVLAALYRLLSRLAARQPPDTLAEECWLLAAQVSVPRVWESPPRCVVAAPHGQPYPLYLEYGVEPEQLSYTAEPPGLEGGTADTDLDSIRYIHLGVCAARVRVCSRCGARTLANIHSARTHAQRAWDMRWVAGCRCGGRWWLQVNT